MLELEETRIDCPYCGESIVILLDPSEPDDQFIEDCQVCCRPIILHVSIDGGEFRVVARREDE